MVSLVAERDRNDNVRFSPLQTIFAQTICKKLNLLTDVSTAVLVETKDGYRCGYTHSTAVLRLFRHMGFPYSALGRILQCIPVAIRDFGYKLFAKNRGTIWKGVKRVTGIGDTMLNKYRDRIVGLDAEDDPQCHIDPGWGLSRIDQKLDLGEKKEDENWQ